MTIKFWGVRGGEVRGGVSGGGGGGGFSVPRGGWLLTMSCVGCGCVLGVSGFSLGDLSVLWIRRGTVCKWRWACVLGGFNDKGPGFQ